MKTLRLLARDIRNGIFARWYLFLIPIVFAVTQSQEFHNYLDRLLVNNTLFAQGTVADYVMFVMKGMNIYYFDPTDTFLIPIYWFAFQIGLAYLVAYYTYDDFNVNGRVLFIASGSRKRWWISKFIYCIVAVVLYFAVCIAAVAVCAKFYSAHMSFETTYALVVHIYPAATVGLSFWELAFIVALLPMLVSVAVCQVQVLLGFVVTPVISFAMVCALYVMSAYSTVWYLVGSYTMWIRSSYVAEDGLNPMSGVVIAAGLIFVSLVGGLAYFNNKDVM